MIIKTTYEWESIDVKAGVRARHPHGGEIMVVQMFDAPDENFRILTVGSGEVGMPYLRSEVAHFLTNNRYTPV